jgi:hypothetical protein
MELCCVIHKPIVVYAHSDQSVDVAVVPVFPDQTILDFKMIPEKLLTTKTSFDKFPISEGSDVFFAGLLMTCFGEHRNIPNGPRRARLF